MSPEAEFLVPNWGIFSRLCIWVVVTARAPFGVVDYIPQSGTENLASEYLKKTTHNYSSGGQISTKHLKTSTRPFFATCRLPQNPEFWRCYRPRHTFLGPHWKRSLKILDTLLTVTTPNTQLLPRPRKMSLSS